MTFESAEHHARPQLEPRQHTRSHSQTRSSPRIVRDAIMPAMEQGDRPRNVYDDPHFLAGYSQMDRFRYGWGGGMEHRAFSALVGSVAGRRVLDLGWGAGHLAFYLA